MALKLLYNNQRLRALGTLRQVSRLRIEVEVVFRRGGANGMRVDGGVAAKVAAGCPAAAACG